MDNGLTHWGRVTHICVGKPSHYLNKCWIIVNWTTTNKLQWNFNRNSNIFIQENAFENVVCEMASICLGLNVLTPDVPRDFVGHFEKCHQFSKAHRKSLMTKEVLTKTCSNVCIHMSKVNFVLKAYKSWRVSYRSNVEDSIWTKLCTNQVTTLAKLRTRVSITVA